MKFAPLGAVTLVTEVTHVSTHGIWLLLDDEELFMPYEQFPWFKNANIASIVEIERPTPNHLYWPLLDIDLAVESIRNPSEFPLMSSVSL